MFLHDSLHSIDRGFEGQEPCVGEVESVFLSQEAPDDMD